VVCIKREKGQVISDKQKLEVRSWKLEVGRRIQDTGVRIQKVNGVAVQK